MQGAQSTATSKASPEDAWLLVADMTRMGEYIPGIQKVQTKPEGAPTGVGTVRQIQIPGGFLMEEKIIEWNEGASYRYSLNQDRWPLAHYESWIIVEPAAGGSSITWGAEWRLVDGMAAAVAGKGLTKALSRMYRKSTERMASLLDDATDSK